jgi:hypothetical protein
MKELFEFNNMSLKNKQQIASIIGPLYQSAIAKPNKELQWKAGAGWVNFIENLEGIGVDFSKVNLDVKNNL